MLTPQPSRIIRFGVFEFDAETGELWNAGRRVRLQEQPRQVLLMLLRRPGQLVTREEVCAALWPDDTFVDFDAGVNVVVNKIRHVLHDSASSPRFIETLPRRGYRFIAPVAPSPVQEAFEDRPIEAVDARLNAEVGNSGRWPVRTLSGHRLAWIGRLAGSAVLALAGISAAIYVYVSRVDDSPGPLRPLPVTTLPGIEYAPAVSPDGSQVAFIADEEGNWNGIAAALYVQPIGASRPLKLTGTEGDASQPTWSPDGRHIAFLRHRDRTTAGHDILLVPATGGAERRLGTVLGERHGLSWSPDGRFLAVVDKPSVSEPDTIYLLSTEDGSKRRLTTAPAEYDGDRFPKFSPDGHSVAFVRVRSFSHADVYVLNLAHQTLTRVASDWIIAGGLDWTQNGGSIIFASGESPPRLWRVGATGGSPKDLGVDGFEPSTSRRNRPLMVFVRFQLDWNVWRVPGPFANASDMSARRLIDSTQLEFSPRYSPSGNRVAFISRRSGTTEVWTSDSDGSNPARLTFLDRDDMEMDVAWSPDGQHLAFTPPVGGSHDIHILSVQGGFPERVTTTPEDERLPSFSHDGRWIYFTVRKGGSDGEIWKVSRAGGPPVRVTRHGGLEARESPDGRFLYFTKRIQGAGPLGIWRMSLANGNEEKIVDHGEAQRWDVFERGICYVAVKPEGGASIECRDATSRSVKQVAVLEKEPLPVGFSVSPDGQSILFIRVDRNESDLMMVENFR
jgi:Tol biopolymer transport system component/DNA-binding winged helix-turn-helix (wHTH) protein